MSDNILDFDKQVDIKVKKELEKKEFDDKLDAIIKSAEIYPDIIKSLTGLRKSVESLTSGIIGVEEKQESFLKISLKEKVSLDELFEKTREVLETIQKLEDNLIDKNNSNSMLEVILEKFEIQNRSMTDKNNPKSIVSLLDKSNKLQSWITWGLITSGTVISIINNLFLGV